MNGIFERRFPIYPHCGYRFRNWSFRVSRKRFTFTRLHLSNAKLVFLSRYGIAPRLLEPGAKPRIEVFNPCDDADDQKTSTAILFSDQGEFIAFGTTALQRYAEMLDDEETGMLF